VRNASTSLKTITAAQADFRANDRDWNHQNDYWRADIAGLYALEVQGTAIKLIELSVAAADDRAAIGMEKFALKGPKAGFWFRALPHAGETTRGPDRFAACTFPESLSAGRYGTYVVSEENVIRRRLLGHAKGIEAYPTSVELKAKEWETID
jgi:hypothetical protein